jgi:hypothetical protein
MEYMRALIMICCPQYPLPVKFLSQRPVTHLLLYTLSLTVHAQFRTHKKYRNTPERNQQKLTPHVQFP